MRGLVYVATLTIGSLFTGVGAHGFLSKPASRNVVYQKGPQFPVSSAMGGGGDIQNLNAGIGGGPEGMAREESQGHGLCGDDSTLRRFMAPNAYGPSEATISEAYVEGQSIDIEVKLTAYHKGWFEFRLCRPSDGGADLTKPITQECLNEHVLKFDMDGNLYSSSDMNSGVSSPADYLGQHAKVQCDGIPGAPSGSCCNDGGDCSDPAANNDRWVVPAKTSDDIYRLKIKLPAGVTCERCVLQWLYQTGNSIWNYPETFWNCADVKIVAGNGEQPSSPTAPPTVPPTTSPTPGATEEQDPVGTQSPTSSTTPSTGGNCRAAGAWAGQANMDAWCETNCGLGNCPATHCVCDGDSDQRRLRGAQ